LRLFGASNLHAVKDGFRVLKTIGTEWRRARLHTKLENNTHTHTHTHTTHTAGSRGLAVRPAPAKDSRREASA